MERDGKIGGVDLLGCQGKLFRLLSGTFGC